jgi:hypothetical protein
MIFIQCAFVSCLFAAAFVAVVPFIDCLFLPGLVGLLKDCWDGNL